MNTLITVQLGIVCSADVLNLWLSKCNAVCQFFPGNSANAASIPSCSDNEIG